VKGARDMVFGERKMRDVEGGVGVALTWFGRDNGGFS